MLKKFGGVPYILWTMIFIILPILIIAHYSITLSDGSFSIKHYAAFFNKTVIDVALRSIGIALITTVVCLLVGYPLAFIMNKVSKKSEKFLVVLLILPMWMNFLLRTYAWQSLLSKNGLVSSFLSLFGIPQQSLLFSLTAVITVMVYNFLPFMVLPIYTVIKKIDKSVIEAAEDLGANKKEIFSRVILPLSIPGIVSGITMTFLPAISSFVIPELIGGGKKNMIGNLIEKQFLLFSNWHFGAALSMVLVLMILVTIFMTNKYKSEDGGQLW